MWGWAVVIGMRADRARPAAAFNWAALFPSRACTGPRDEGSIFNELMWVAHLSPPHPPLLLQRGGWWGGHQLASDAGMWHLSRLG